MNSIRHRLLLSLLVGLLASTAIMIGVAYIDTTNELQELFTDNLRRMAVVIKGQAFTPEQVQNTPRNTDDEELEESYVIQTWNGQGKLLHSSRPDFDIPLQAQEGFGRVEKAGREWQVYTLKAGSSGYVQIAQPQKIVATMIGESALHALFPLALLFILMVVGGWIAVGRSLTPLNTLSETITGWDANNMRPLRISDTPNEIQPVVSALNNMLLRLDKAMSLQRQFMADAAHELRTPLTAIKLQLDNLLRSQSDNERMEAQQKLSNGIDRCIHLAGQLLTASRSLTIPAARKFKPVAFDKLLRSAIADFVALATRKKIEISFDHAAGCAIYGDEENLRILANNLIDNAIRYTPTGGAVIVRLYKNDKHIVLDVEDTGPGIPESEREIIFHRFYRMPGTTATGSGLGLAIVKNIAEAHGATVSIVAPASHAGSIFRVNFPLAGGTA